MIAALGVKRGDFEKAEINDVVLEKGLVGYAPTQGHIPSGVPYIGFAREGILNDELNRVMIVGKGSLFLGRLTNLFDGVSFVIEKNSGIAEDQNSVSKEDIRNIVAESLRNLANNL